MQLEIQKKGQGTWARGSAYGLIAILVVFGAIQLFATINVPGAHVWASGVPILGDITPYKVIAFVVFLLGLLAVHLVLNRAKVVDVLIDTESEMRKVSWPSRREVKSATIVVAVVTIVLGLSLYGFDAVLRRIFHLIF